MISLVIIGAMAMAVAPSLSEVLNDNRQHSAAVAVVRAARRARSLTLMTGVCQVLRFRGASHAESSNGLGRLEVLHGMNRSCLQTPWPQAHRHTVLDMLDYNPVAGGVPQFTDQNRHVIFLSARIGNNLNGALQNTLSLCYQPNGDMYYRTLDANPWVPQDLPLLFFVYRQINGAARGQSREIILPPFGNARMR